MTDGPATNDTSASPLTVTSAAKQVEGLLFPSEDKTAPANKPAKNESPTDAPELSEPLDAEGQSETEDSDYDADLVDELSPDADEPVDSDESVDEDEDEAPKKEPEPEQKFKVKVRGEELEVTRDELLNGYCRHADYTRSKQELAAAREKFEKEELPVARERAVKYAEGLTQIEEALKALTPAEPDWDQVALEHPESFANQRELWRMQQERLAAVSAEREKAQEAVAKDQAEQRQRILAAEIARLPEVIPAWKDEAVAKKEKVEIYKYATDLGFTDEDLKSIVSANTLLILRNAYLYDKSQKAKPVVKDTIERVKAATPGPNAEAKPEVTKQTRRKQRFAKTRSVRDAASVLEHSGLLD